MLLILLNVVIYKPVTKVYRCVRTSVRVYTSYIFYLCWNYEL